MDICVSTASKGNQAERCIKAALSSARELIISLALAPLDHLVTQMTAGEMVPTIMTKRGRVQRGNGGKITKRKRTSVTCRIITTDMLVRVYHHCGVRIYTDFIMKIYML